MAYQPYSYSAQVHPPVPYQYAPGYAIPADYNAYYGISPQVPEPPSQQPPPPPLHIQTVNASVASQSLRRLLSSELRTVGFKRYETAVLTRLENEVVSCLYLVCWSQISSAH